jgi:hypothetical protein
MRERKDGLWGSPSLASRWIPKVEDGLGAPPAVIDICEAECYTMREDVIRREGMWKARFDGRDCLQESASCRDSILRIKVDGQELGKDSKLVPIIELLRADRSPLLKRARWKLSGEGG